MMFSAFHPNNAHSKPASWHMAALISSFLRAFPTFHNLFALLILVSLRNPTCFRYTEISKNDVPVTMQVAATACPIE